MKEEIARRWVEELRSGRHAQCKGVLRDATGAKCCLGVLQFDVLGLAPSDEHLPDAAALEASGLKSPGGFLNRWHTRDGELPAYLFELNDDKGLNFAQIADIIEANWEKL